MVDEQSKINARKSFVVYIIFFTISFFVGTLMYYNLMPDKTSQHTGTVPGTSGDLKCTTSCVVKE